MEAEDCLKCNKCKYKAKNTQKSYLHTISHTQPLSLRYTEDITDYPCPECNQKSFTNTTKLTLSASLFIVHINQFSVNQGSPRKELPTQPIFRTFKGYELVGILFHIGKTVQVGHYTYYFRVDKKKWVDMNDKYVREFTLDREDEAFETNMNSAKTPYLLFYKKSE